MSRRPLVATMSHPIVIAAVATLILNDHVLKEVWPGWVTGKLSDFAGLVFFPVLLGALIEIVAPERFDSRRLLLACVAATGMVFAAVQLLPLAGEGYQAGLGLLQWPFRLVADGSPEPTRVALTQDSTDLLALPMLWVPWLIGSRRLPETSPYVPTRS